MANDSFVAEVTFKHTGYLAQVLLSLLYILYNVKVRKFV